MVARAAFVIPETLAPPTFSPHSKALRSLFLVFFLKNCPNHPASIALSATTIEFLQLHLEERPLNYSITTRFFNCFRICIKISSTRIMSTAKRIDFDESFTLKKLECFAKIAAFQVVKIIIYLLFMK